jgi:hypothetical protein
MVSINKPPPPFQADRLSSLQGFKAVSLNSKRREFRILVEAMVGNVCEALPAKKPFPAAAAAAAAAGAAGGRAGRVGAAALAVAAAGLKMYP